eukprot:g8269.t1
MLRLQRSSLRSLVALCVAAAGISMMARDVRAEDREYTDQQISDHIDDELLLDHAVLSSRIDVQTTAGIVTLTGTVDNILSKDRAARIAETVKGVRSVINRIEVKPPKFLKDEVLRNEIVSSLAADPATDSWEIDVVARDGAVTLTGTVGSRQERELAGKVAKGVRGVTRLTNLLRIAYQKSRTDREIQSDIEQTLRWDLRVDAGLIDVRVDDGNVKLTGTIGSAAEKRIAQADAWTVGVKSVDAKELTVEGWARDPRRRTAGVATGKSGGIRDALREALMLDPRVMSFRVTPVVAGSLVTLRGKVDNFKAKRAAEQVARRTAGVSMVINRIKVRPKQDVPDADIASGIRRALKNDPYVNRQKITVAVVNGVAHLSGRVDNNFEETRAIDVASRVKGVVSVEDRIVVDYDKPAIYDSQIDDVLPITPYRFDRDSLKMLTTKSDEQIKKDINDQFYWSPYVDASQMSESPATRASLLVRVRDHRDDSSWRQFVEIYAPLIHAYGRHHGLQDADAADLAQDVLQSLAGAVGSFDYDPDRGSFRGWLLTITRNRLRTTLERRTRRGQGTGRTAMIELLHEQPGRESSDAFWNRQHQMRLFHWAAEQVRDSFQESTWEAFWSTSVDNEPAEEAIVDDGLSAERLHDCTAHLDRCADCRDRLESLVAGDTIPEAQFQNVDPPGDRTELDRVIRRLQNGATARTPATGLGSPLAFLAPTDRPDCLGRFGPYDVIEVIGQGGMGIVFKARDPALDRVVAIKVLPPALAIHPEMRQRFVREARSAAAVEHDHIVAIYAVAEENEVPYLVMQYVDGESLQQRIDRGGPLSDDETLRVGREIAWGLAAAHKQGLIHRDIKPANILLEGETGRARITDFGLARAVDDAGLTNSGVVAGTPQYMAPEQAKGEPLDHRTDLFSLGSVLYTSCTGRCAFGGATTYSLIQQVCHDEPADVRTINPDVSKRLATIIRRLMAKAADDRFASAEQLAESMSPDADMPTLPSLTRPDLSTANTPHRRKPLVTTIAAAILLLAAIGVAVFHQSRDDEPADGSSDTEKPAASASGFRIVGTGEMHARLRDAIKNANDGDVIEVQGDGPFRVDAVQVRGKRLTLRAAAGSRPVILPREPGRSRPLIDSDAELVLENIELRWGSTGARRPPVRIEDVFLSCAIHVEGGMFRATNCRFVVDGENTCVGINGGKCELKNCHFVAKRGEGVVWRTSSRAGLVCVNSVAACRTAFSVLPGVDATDAAGACRFELNRNTFESTSLLQIQLPRGGMLRQLRSRTKSWLAVVAKSNLIKTTTLLDLQASGLRSSPPTRNAEDVHRFLGGLLAWSEQENYYSDVANWIEFSARGRMRPNEMQGVPQSLQHWLRFWKLAETASMKGTVRFPADRPPTSVDHFRPRTTDPKPNAAIAAPLKDVGPR